MLDDLREAEADLPDDEPRAFDVTAWLMFVVIAALLVAAWVALAGCAPCPPPPANACTVVQIQGVDAGSTSPSWGY